jgi:aryl-alcohol dehydrogenase-like predicted oxidoreductase
VLAQGENIIMIPGSKRLKHLEENIASEKSASQQRRVGKY